MDNLEEKITNKYIKGSEIHLYLMNNQEKREN